MKERIIPATRFKNSCLALLDEVREQRIPITVTKRGKPVARIIPVTPTKGRRSLIGSVVYEAKDISTTRESFEADA